MSCLLVGSAVILEKLKMKKLWEFVKKYYEPVGYAGLVVLLFGACFSPVFAWLSAGWALALAGVFHNESKVIGLLLGLYCFYALFDFPVFPGVNSHNLLLAALIVFVIALYVVRVVRREKQLNIKILIPLGLFIVYMMLPFHTWHWVDLVSQSGFLLFLYVVFEERRELDFRAIVRVFAAGLVVSCLFALLRPVSALLDEQMTVNYANQKLRFQGLMVHPNHLGPLVVLTSCALLLLKYQKHITWQEFFCWFVPLFVFGFQTLSRGFVLSAGAGFGVFTVFYLVKYRTQGLGFVGAVLAVVAVVALVFFADTKIIFQRIENTENLSHFHICEMFQPAPSDDPDSVLYGKSEEWIRGLFAGEFYYDPGRKGLRELYLTDWSSSAQTIWLGRGVSRVKIGQMNMHNLLIRELWHHGLVGYAFYLAMILCSINWRKLKNWRCIVPYLPMLILLVPYAMIAYVETRPFDYTLMTLIIMSLGMLSMVQNMPEAKDGDETVG